MESYVFRWRSSDFEALVESCTFDTVTPYILKYLPTEGKIVEAGCGLARFIAYLKDRGYDIEGIEISSQTVEQVKTIRPDLQIIVGDITHLPYADNSLSGMISLGVIEHFPAGPESPLREAYRTLKPGSLAIITVPEVNLIRRVKYAIGYYHLNHWLRQNPFLRRALGKTPRPPNEKLKPVDYRFRRWPTVGDFYEYRLTKAEFETHLLNAGFEIIESAPIGQMDGLFHDFGRCFVSFRNWKFYPNIVGKALNAALSAIPDFHNHMHLCVVGKPVNPRSSVRSALDGR